MKKVGIAFVVVLLVLAGVVLVGPGLVDWNTYRARIAAEIQDSIGRPVSIDGDIDLGVLPLPHVTVNAVRVANPAGFAHRDMLSLKRLDARVALLPLLGGRIQVESVRLVEPVVALERQPAGGANWDFGAKPPAASSSPAQQAASAPPLAFERISIENGAVSYSDAGATYRVEKIDAQLSAASLQGPFRAEGSIVAQGVPLTVDLDLGRVDSAAPASVQFTAAVRDPDATLRFDGILVTAGESRLDGTVRVQAPQMRAAASKYLGLTQLPPGLAGPADLRGALLASAKGASLGGAELALGAMRASGSMALEPGAPSKLEIALSTGAVDLDSLLPSAPGGAPTGPPGAAIPPSFSLPDRIAVGLRLSSESASFRGATVRQAAFVGELAGGVLTVDRASALLPGESDVRLSGMLKAQQGLPVVEGRIEVDSQNLRRSLEWLGVTQTAMLPPERLRSFTGVAEISGTPRDLRISGLDATLDETKVTGAVAYTNHGRPAYGVRLTADRLDLDGYLPARQVTPQPSAGANAGAAPPLPANLVERLNELDANVALQIGTVTYGGVRVNDVALDGTLFKGGLTLRTARLADLAGLSLSAEGSMASLAPLSGVDLRLAAASKSLEPVYRSLKIDPPVSAALLEAVDLKLRVTGDEKKAAMELAAALAGGSIEAGGTVADLFSQPSYDLKLRVRHPDFARVLAKAGYRPAGRELKALDLYAAATGSTNAAALADLQGQLGPVTVKGAGSANWAEPRLKISAQLQASEIDLNQLLPAPVAATPARAPAQPRPVPPAPTGQGWSTEPIDVGWLRAVEGDVKLNAAALVYDRYRVTEPALLASLENGSLVLKQLDGGLFGGRIGLKGRLEASDRNAAPRIAADLTVVRAQLRQALDKSSDLDINGLMDLDTAIAAAGRSEAEMVRSLSGTSKLAIRDGVVRGFDLKAMSDRLGQIDEPKDFLGLIGQSMSGGQTRFSALTGSFGIDRGIARTDDLRLEAEAGEATGRGSVDLPAWTADMQTRFHLTEHPKAPGFGMRISGPLDRPQRAFDAGELSAYVAQRVGKELLRKAAPGLNIPGITAPTDGKSGKAPEPEKVIRGLLDSLRR